MKEVVILSGIPYHEIKDYFEKAAKPLCLEKYLGEKWEVALETSKDREYKNIRIPRTRIVFKGEEEAVDTAVQRYRRAFLRGGA